MQSPLEVHEPPSVLVVTSSSASIAVGHLLSSLCEKHKLKVFEASTVYREALLPDSVSGYGVNYTVGGGLSADAGKYFAAKLGLPLTVIPIALTADSFFIASSGVLQDGCVVYPETGVPDSVLLYQKSSGLLHQQSELRGVESFKA